MQDQRSDGMTRWALIIIGIGIIIAVGMMGGIQSEAVWAIIITIALLLILLGILWNYRSKLSGLLIALLLLFILFFVTGFIITMMGLTKNPFNLGIVTIIVILIFAIWIDGEKLQKEYFKFIIFDILIIIAVISGFLPMMNDTVGKIFSFLKGM